MYGEIWVSFRLFFTSFENFFLKSTAKSGKYFSVNSHLKCQLFQVFSSVAKLNLFLLNSICFTWLNLLSPQFWGSYSWNLPTLSLLPYFMLSLVGIFKHNSGTQMALKINGTWLPNHTKFSASSTIFCLPYLLCSPLWNSAPLSDVVNLLSSTITLNGPLPCPPPLNVVWRQYLEHPEDWRCEPCLDWNILAVTRFHTVSAICVNSRVPLCLNLQLQGGYTVVTPRIPRNWE